MVAPRAHACTHGQSSNPNGAKLRSQGASPSPIVGKYIIGLVSYHDPQGVPPKGTLWYRHGKGGLT